MEIQKIVQLVFQNLEFIFGMETKDAVVINPNSENEFDYLDLETGNEQTYTYTGDAGLVLNFF